MMNELDNIQYSPIRSHPYKQWFRDVQFNGKILNTTERKEFIAIADETISGYYEGLPMISSELERIKDLHDEYHEMYRTLLSVMLFVMITMIDSMAISKYFILADKDYDRRFMRGKMKVILNEGFKRLYGFKEGKDSKWDELGSILKYFPEEIKKQYQELSSLLEEQAKYSSWWKDERDSETHLDAEKLYASRCEDVIESKVMMDSLKLFNALYAVDGFLINMHVCINNFLINKYQRRELKEEQFK